LSYDLDLYELDQNMIKLNRHAKHTSKIILFEGYLRTHRHTHNRRIALHDH